jgi:hypothetical protein
MAVGVSLDYCHYLCSCAGQAAGQRYVGSDGRKVNLDTSWSHDQTSLALAEFATKYIRYSS